MQNFQIYKHPFYGFECVKIGFSWPAFFFGTIWMLFSRLWLSAFTWITIYLLSLYVLDTQPENILIVLALIAVFLALWLVPAFEGNNWRIANLQKRGFEFLKVVQADSKESALAIATYSPIEKPENESDSHMNNDHIFVSNFSQDDSFVPILYPFLVVVGLSISLLFSRPTEADFLNYIQSDDRIKSEIAAQLRPGDQLAAVAIALDFFQLADSVNVDDLNPKVVKKDYRLFVLYSFNADIKPYDNKFKNLKSLSKVDIVKVMGFNATYVGFWGMFFRLNNEGLKEEFAFNPDQTRLPKESDALKDESNVTTRESDYVTEESNVETSTDEEYVNDRFQYRLTYPKGYLIPQGESDNGDGQVFLSEDSKVKLVIYARTMFLDESLESEYESALSSDIEGREITLKDLKQKWYVISGYEGDTKFYENKFLDNDKFITLNVTYPKDEKELGDKLLKIIKVSTF